MLQINVPHQHQKIVQLNPPIRRTKNSDVRSREFLLQEEVFKLALAARKNQIVGHRDQCMVLMMYYHGGLVRWQICNGLRLCLKKEISMSTGLRTARLVPILSMGMC